MFLCDFIWYLKLATAFSLTDFQLIYFYLLSLPPSFPYPNTMTAAMCLISEILEPNSIIFHQRVPQKKEEEGKANKQKRWQNVAAFWAKNRNLKAESPIRRGVFWEYWDITYSLAEATDVQLTQGAGVWVCVCLGVCAASAMQGNKPKIRQQQNHKTKATHTQTQTHKHTHTQLWQVNEVILIMATMVDHLVHQHAAGICHGPETRI